MTCVIRLSIGAAVLHMSPAGSCFWRAIRRRMIHDSTIATRAKEGTGSPELLVASTKRSPFGSPPRTFSFKEQLALLKSLAAKFESMFFAEELSGIFPSKVILGTRPVWRFAKSLSQRRCCSASACMRLNKCTISAKKAVCSQPPPLDTHSTLTSSGLTALVGTRCTEGCKKGVHTSPLASKAMAMHAPSSHFAPILCTASRPSQ
mmetsp:Transcript_44941/g.103892  ORF Transcript_44941/g.103892 Transcript_44941/m.103892 type:complete len:205 (-) Transcript_44941:313-927(-)